MNEFVRWSAWSLVLSIASIQSSRAQCPAWNEGFDEPGASDAVGALAVYDDGSGPALYAGGSFDRAGGVTAHRIAKWDGSNWSALGGGMNDDVTSLCVFDDGSGPALYAAGGFVTVDSMPANRIARWNGTSWSPLGTGVNNWVNALAVYDDGSGAALYAGGSFTMAGGGAASRVAKWNGSSWSAVGAGTNNIVTALTVFDDGTGAALCAGGPISSAGGTPVQHVAKWNGSSWTAVGDGLGQTIVVTLGVFDAGAGQELYAGRGAAGGGTGFMWRLDGASWTTLASSGSGNDNVNALSVFDDGTGPALFVGGYFSSLGGVSATNVAKWDGTTFTPIGIGTSRDVHAFAGYDDGAGLDLYVGGQFTRAGTAGVNRVARWDGVDYSALGTGDGANAAVRALLSADAGPSLGVLAGGEFTNAGDVVVNRVAGWNGSAWSPLGDALSSFPSSPSQYYVAALELFDDGAGLDVFVAGRFGTVAGRSANQIAQWDGSTWSALGTGITGTAAHVDALEVFDDGSGSALYAAGTFTNAGGSSAANIARWNGSAWSAVGGGLPTVVNALTVFDDGTGSALYAGGALLRRWNGTSWSSQLGVANVRALCVHDDGTGAALYAGGTFTMAGSVSANRVAKWNGSSWSALGSGTDDQVLALTVFDDGGGPALYAGGKFTMAGGAGASHVAKWNGTSWSPLGSGTDGDVLALSVSDVEGDGILDLYLGGTFTIAGGVPSTNIAKWSSCGPGLSYCFGDGIDPLVTAQCPCANLGNPGRGCANSNAALGGAYLSATGTTSPNTVLLTCDGIPNGNLCTFLRGTASVPAGAVFGDGVSCVSGTLVRFGQQTSGLGGNPSNTVSVGAITVAPGNTRYYHVQYRNPAPAFGPPATFNGSNAYVIRW